MSEIAKTPEPPYYAVIFTSHRTEGDNSYGEVADKMVKLASKQPGFLGVESARESVGITVSYWKDLESIKVWKQNVDHIMAQQRGRKFGIRNLKHESAKLKRITASPKGQTTIKKSHDIDDICNQCKLVLFSINHIISSRQ